MFTQPVIRVEDTAIFARLDDSGHQYLAYSMNVKLGKQNAMILPVPVCPDEAKFEFLDLEAAPDLFPSLEQAFLAPRSQDDQGWLSADDHDGQTLEVVDVGSFEASFVPRQPDFSRLDKRFQFNSTIWSQLPHYEDYGFAVFQLKSGEKRVHPMGMKFATRYPDQLFFPTVHVHDGQVHEEEDFEHSLYCQTETRLHEAIDALAKTDSRWSGAGQWHHSHFDLGEAIAHGIDLSGLLDRGSKGFKRTLLGKLPNVDIFIPALPSTEPDPSQDGHVRSKQERHAVELTSKVDQALEAATWTPLRGVADEGMKWSPRENFIEALSQIKEAQATYQHAQLAEEVALTLAELQALVKLLGKKRKWGLFVREQIPESEYLHVSKRIGALQGEWGDRQILLQASLAQ